MDWNPQIHGSLLRHARAKEGLTRKALAEQLEVSPLSVFNWENGKNAPQNKSLKAIIEKFGEAAFNPESVVIQEEGPAALASWVSAKRAEKKWSRKELAQKARVSEMTIECSNKQARSRA